MLVKGQGIVFQTIRYGESSLIAKIYTREAGMISFLVKGARTNKGSIRASHLMPMNLTELIFNLYPNKNLQHLKELRCNPILPDLLLNESKRSIVLFLSEVLNRSVKEEEKNADLFDFISGSLQILNEQNAGFQLFPHYFMIQLTKYLGFYPDHYFDEGMVFNLQEGRFVTSLSMNNQMLSGVESEILGKLLKVKYSDLMDLKVNTIDKRSLLEHLLLYYRIHLGHFNQVNSHEVFKDLLANS